MVENKQINWPGFSTDAAIGIGIQTFHYYAVNHRRNLVDVVLPDEEVEKKLLDLAENIMMDKVKSHEEISKVVLCLGVGFGAFGGISSEINQAAARVGWAISQKKNGFVEPGQ